ncbi:MAG: hypothetical protein Q9179_007103 [Wetmoreana sp. 5 TL-2023]
MSSNVLYTSLLRPPILHILRAAGFHATKPAVLDTLVDLAARYIALLASKAASHAQENHNDLELTITDVRMALQDVGALWPQKSAMEEHITGQEDMRGIEAFVKWMRGEENREIRRIAGLVERDASMTAIDGHPEKEDFLTALKKKHNKTGESSRFQGTVLGTSAEDKLVRIEGGPADTLQDWSAKLRKQSQAKDASLSRQPSSALASTMSSPLFDYPRFSCQNSALSRITIPYSSGLDNFDRSDQEVSTAGKNVGRGLGGGFGETPYTMTTTTFFGPTRPSPPSPGEVADEHRSAMREAAFATVNRSKVSSSSGSFMSMRMAQDPCAHVSGITKPA